MDSPKDIDQYYRKQYKIYDATRSSFLFGRNKLAQLVNQDLNENDTILEVGCGTGYLLKRIETCDKYGIDLSSEMLSLAKKKLGESAVLENTLLEEYKPDFKFDKVILAYYFTISLSQKESQLEKIKSLLSDGGFIYVVDFHRYGNSIYKKYMNWHGIEINPNLSQALEGNFDTVKLSIQKAYAGMWEYFIYKGVYRA